MSERGLAEAIFGFEDITRDLDLVPIAGRRALDRAGLRLPLEGWRSLSFTDRLDITLAGAEDVVDVAAVTRAAKRSRVPAAPIEPVPDPDALRAPEPLVEALLPRRTLDNRAWLKLRAVDRYALAHIYRRAVARNEPFRLNTAYDVVVENAVPDRRGDSISPARGGQGDRRSSVVPSSAASLSRSKLPPPPGAPGEVSAGAAAAVELDDPAEVDALMGEHPGLSHLDAEGKVRMVDVAQKAPTHRTATASGRVWMNPETAALVLNRGLPKGEVLSTARLAGIMAAKRTPELIPLCHGIALTSVEVELAVDSVDGFIDIVATARAFDRTGVEMEAMTAVSVAALTIYDMLKGVDRAIAITDIELDSKSGGRSGDYRRSPREDG